METARMRLNAPSAMDGLPYFNYWWTYVFSWIVSWNGKKPDKLDVCGENK